MTITETSQAGERGATFTSFLRIINPGYQMASEPKLSADNAKKRQITMPVSAIVAICAIKTKKLRNAQLFQVFNLFLSVLPGCKSFNGVVF